MRHVRVRKVWLCWVGRGDVIVNVSWGEIDLAVSMCVCVVVCVCGLNELSTRHR